MTHKSRKNSCFEVLDGLFCELQASSVTWTMDILYRGLGIGKLQFLIKKKLIFFSAEIFFQFLVISALDPDWIRIRIHIGLQPQPLDPDPEKTNTDPKPWLQCYLLVALRLEHYQSLGSGQVQLS